MKITAKIPLNLPNKFYKIILKYDTFEKATYDAYLIASLMSVAKTEKEVFKYIDEITGKGSLNGHFKKIYAKMKDLSNEQIKGILKDSLYPVTVIDQKNHFKYYPMFNATRYKGKTYAGNLATLESLKDMIMPTDKQCKFLSLDFQSEDGTVKSDIYDVIIAEDSILVDLEDGRYWSISLNDFYSVYKNEIDNELLRKYEGVIKMTPSENELSILRNEVLNSLRGAKNYFIDENGNHCEILDDYLKRTELFQIYSLYFFSEKRIKYNSKNQSVCEKVISHLMEGKGINEFKTKSLINILECVEERTAQNVVSYVLSRKDSKEIALVGLGLIKNGLEKGWNDEVLKSIKKSTAQDEFKYLYRINNDLGFKIQDLLFIEDIDLNSRDKNLKSNYIAVKENMKKEIDSMIGEITNSAIRQRMKKLPTKDSIYKILNDFLNKYVGHKQTDYNSLEMDALEKEYNNIKRIYNNAYQTIKERCEKNENA